MPTSGRQMLWWGRFDPGYSRNGILRSHLAALGWTVADFHPRFCALGDLEAALRRLPRPEAVWVPCFRQRDVAAARRWCDRQGVPLLFDPLISAYDKQVFERFKLAEGSRAAQRLLAQEQRLFAKADTVLADTSCHAGFFAQTLGVAKDKIHVVYVGADETLFNAAPKRMAEGPAEVLFFGSFIPLHGAETIVEAARIYQGPSVRWCLLGDGPEKSACVTAAAGLTQVAFENPTPYVRLPARIHCADILLGVFGTTQKAGRVIPNKVFQALASGRPVITRTSEAYPHNTRASSAVSFVPPGDPQALAAAVASWVTQREMLAERGQAARVLYETCFSAAVVRSQLEQSLKAL